MTPTPPPAAAEVVKRLRYIAEALEKVRYDYWPVVIRAAAGLIERLSAELAAKDAEVERAKQVYWEWVKLKDFPGADGLLAAMLKVDNLRIEAERELAEARVECELHYLEMANLRRMTDEYLRERETLSQRVHRQREEITRLHRELAEARAQMSEVRLLLSRWVNRGAKIVHQVHLDSIAFLRRTSPADAVGEAAPSARRVRITPMEPRNFEIDVDEPAPQQCEPMTGERRDGHCRDCNVGPLIFSCRVIGDELCHPCAHKRYAKLMRAITESEAAS